MAVMGLLFPAVLRSTHTELHSGKSELALSRFSSGIMLVAYAAYLVFQLKSDKNLYLPVDEVDSSAFILVLNTIKYLTFYLIVFLCKRHYIIVITPELLMT